MRVEYVAHSGDDLLVVNAARASFGKESKWEWENNPKNPIGVICAPIHPLIRKLPDKDKKLLDYLAREKHVLPFRHPQITLRCQAPIFLARQFGKHQVGMSWSEESRRYIDSDPTFFCPDKWRARAENVKQGSSDEEVVHMTMTNDVESWSIEVANAYQLHVAESVQLYKGMLKAGVAPELARVVLPQSMEVTWVWTGSLLSFFQMYVLRAEATAQKEARDFVELIKEKVSGLYPESWKALERNV